MYTKIAIAILLAWAFILPASAQENSIPACTADELETINEAIEENLIDFAAIVESDLDDLVEVLDDITILQRRYWTPLAFGSIPNCVEKYTRYYEFGRVLDEYAIAFGLLASSGYAELSGNDGEVERMRNQAEKHINNAADLFDSLFPDDDE